MESWRETWQERLRWRVFRFFEWPLTPFLIVADGVRGRWSRWGQSEDNLSEQMGQPIEYEVDVLDEPDTRSPDGPVGADH